MADNPSKKDEVTLGDLGKTALAMLFFAALALLVGTLFWAFGKEGFGPALLIALAAFWSGVMPGFLFGIPRLRATSSAPAAPAGNVPTATTSTTTTTTTVHRPGTNLEELSDWLTKIIVGLGLATITQAPKALTSLGIEAAKAFGTKAPPPPSLVIAAMLMFAIFGFLSSYLGTQIFLAGQLKKAADDLEKNADQEAKEAVQRARESVRSAELPTAEAAQDSQQARQTLETLADAYLKIDIQDDRLRTEAKTKAAAEMGQLINTAKLNRDELVSGNNEGLFVGLANAIVSNPQPGDADRLIAIGTRANRLHVQYAIVVAYLALLDRGLVSPEQKRKFLPILDFYATRADDSLRTIIDSARRKSV